MNHLNSVVIDSLSRVSKISGNISELIMENSPVFIKSYGIGSMATASFRGAASTHTKIMWNGMEINSPMNGVSDLSLLPVFFTDEIYLLNGGNSLSEIAGALGGVVGLYNSPVWDSKFKVKLLAEWGSFSTGKLFSGISLGSRKFKSETRFFFDKSKNNFTFFNYGILPHRLDTLENAGYHKQGLLQEFYYRPGNNHSVVFRFWIQGSSRDLPPLMTYEGKQRIEKQEDMQKRVQLEWKHYGNKANFQLNSSCFFNHLHYLWALSEPYFINEDSKSNEWGWDNRIRINYKVTDKQQLDIELKYRLLHAEVNDFRRNTGYSHDRSETGVMAGLQLFESKKLDLHSSFRIENYDFRVTKVAPAASIKIKPSGKNTQFISANLVHNFKYPTLNDLYWMPGGNTNLKPEKSTTGEMIFSYAKSDKSLYYKSELTAFVSVIDNWIQWQPSANGAYYWEAANISKVFSRGLEFLTSVSASVNKIKFNSGLNYSFTRTSDLNALDSPDKSRKKQLIYIPVHKGNSYVNVHYKNYSLKFDVSYIGKRFTKTDNSETNFEKVLNPYFLSRITLMKQLIKGQKEIYLKLTVDNLFNQNYQSILWRPMPGRNYLLSLSVNLTK